MIREPVRCTRRKRLRGHFFEHHALFLRVRWAGVAGFVRDRGTGCLFGTTGAAAAAAIIHAHRDVDFAGGFRPVTFVGGVRTVNSVDTGTIGSISSGSVRSGSISPGSVNPGSVNSVDTNAVDPVSACGVVLVRATTDEGNVTCRPLNPQS